MATYCTILDAFSRTHGIRTHTAFSELRGAPFARAGRVPWGRVAVPVGRAPRAERSAGGQAWMWIVEIAQGVVLGAWCNRSVCVMYTVVLG